MDVVNDVDETVATIRRLAELGPVIDDHGDAYFANVIELLALITQQAGHLEKLSSQLAHCVLGPRPVPPEEQP
jgi:hypothetical protein